MKKLVITIFVTCFVVLGYSQTEVVKFEYTPNGERKKREVIVLGGKDHGKSSQMFFMENELSKISVYPNPVKYHLNIELEGDFYEQKIKYHIYTIQGAKIDVGDISENSKIKLEHLAPGTYFLTMFVDDSQKTWKILKE